MELMGMKKLLNPIRYPFEPGEKVFKNNYHPMSEDLSRVRNRWWEPAEVKH